MPIPGTSLLRSIQLQSRVVGALVLREVITRYGRHNIGFLWLFVEPMMFTAGVTVIWTVLHSVREGLQIIPFAITGYSPVMLWRNGVSRCAGAVEPNKSLLFHRNVCVIDFFWARIILEVMAGTASFIILGTGAVILGLMKPPQDFGLIIAGWLLLAWYTLGLGLIVGAFSEISELIERVWHIVMYLYLPISGLFFMVEWLPVKIRPYAMLVPTVNFSEMIRGGYYGSAVHPYYDIFYAISINLILTWIGLMLVKYVGKNVEGE
jgi:capsular polysaccharide transport system permease protein